MNERRVRGLVFDIDGSLMRGPDPIPGAPETLADLRSRGLAVRFFTNDSSRTPAEIAGRLERAGISATADEVLTAALVAADHAARRHAGGRAVVIGGRALIDALEGRGLHVVDGPPAEVVVVGRDVGITYAKLDAACRAIWGGAAFVATNLDRRMPVKGGFVPGTGTLVKAVEWATARAPQVMGKPSAEAARAAFRSLGLPSREVAVVGDALQQDVRMGRVGGAVSVLVLTGSSTRAEAEAAPRRWRPDAILADVTELGAWLERSATQIEEVSSR